MTRETKIGLLVGLAFIIVIGILLSDHLTTSTEPPTAPLARAGATVREAVTTIGQPTAPVIVSAPERVTPSRPIVTREELTQPPPIELAPSAPVRAGDPPTVMAHAGASSDADAVTQTALPITASTDPLARLATQHQDELQVVSQPTPVASPRDLQPAAPVATRTYVVQPGDSVSRIASRMLGANTKANRDAIVRANPSLAADPNRVIVGRTYIIPTGTVPQPAARVVIPTPASIVTTADARPASPSPRRSTDAATYWYTVKENDSLWRIASEQLGTGNAYQQIKDLNKDVLKGGDSVRPNMRLRLPTKPVASAG